ncbi:DUF3883 domain-containing protein [Streptomyces sp. CMB-StM0423]|uniref:DUF3883 domain-containing protein n=1 Tax=Streptomyces sp. CMB-StM0423 TaxID=2059884 RepID=UPI00131C40F1|nr:DUF3883 domain-containing protein [Streptomyces sp. CMB-StM0423]
MDVLVTTPEELPGDALSAARAVGLSAEEAFACVRAAWGKIDTAQRERIGGAGERALVHLLCEGLPEAAEVLHVAAEADCFGYDIAVRAVGLCAHIEVKSTTRRGRLPVYLSRNEYETMRNDASWQLVAVRLTEGLKAAAVATVPAVWIATQAPADRGAAARWESCRFDVPRDVLVPGISGLREIVDEAASAILGGAVDWPG